MLGMLAYIGSGGGARRGGDLLGSLAYFLARARGPVGPTDCCDPAVRGHAPPRALLCESDGVRTSVVETELVVDGRGLLCVVVCAFGAISRPCTAGDAVVCPVPERSFMTTSLDSFGTVNSFA